MARNVIGMYRDLEIAESLVQDLLRSGVDRNHISVVSHHATEKYRDLSTMSDRKREENAGKGAGVGAAVGAVGGVLLSIGLAAIPGVGWILGAGPVASILATGGIGAAVGAAAGGLGGALSKAGVPEGRAGRYAEAIRRGGALVAVEVEDQHARRIADLMERYDPVDIDRSAKRWRDREGWETYDPKARPFSTQEVESERDLWRREAATGGVEQSRTTETGKTIPIVEEEVDVDKREVVRGGARVHTYPVERPVEEEVRLREEHVDVSREQVNRPADATTRDRAFRDETVEVVEHGEEPVVRKEARVTEEVTVGKTSSERTEHIRDTERHTEVEIERLSAAEFGRFEPGFRQHFDSNYRGEDWDTFRSAYEMGVVLSREGFQGDGQRRDWLHMEPRARQLWQGGRFRHVPFERVRSAMQHGYDEASTGRV